jgi:hypothetical protein
VLSKRALIAEFAYQAAYSLAWIVVQAELMGYRLRRRAMMMAMTVLVS